MEFIDLKSQYQRLKDPIGRAIQRVLDHGQYIMGPEIQAFESELAQFIGVKHCVSLSNGTDALLLSMMALGISAGDEVITSPFTFIANAEMMALVGIKPVFVDIDSKTYNMDPSKIQSAITKKTKAIMPVSLYGQCADMDAINAVAAKNGLPVIEDAAQSFGGRYKGRWSCALSTIGSTSFFPSKPLGAYGDAGACFTNDDQLADKLAKIRLHGQDGRYHHTMVGVNARMDTLQAAILIEKLKVFPEELTARDRIGKRYSELLKDHVGTPFIEAENVSAYAQYTIRVPNRAAVLGGLKELGIPTAVHYPGPLHLQPCMAYLNLKSGSFPNSESAAAEVLSLPMHPYLSTQDQDKVVACVIRAVGRS